MAKLQTCLFLTAQNNLIFKAGFMPALSFYIFEEK